MLTILNATIPFFAVISCGYLGGMLGILGPAGRAGLNSFVFHFALPVLLFSVMSAARFDTGFEWRLILAWCLVSITLFMLIFLLAKPLFKLGPAEGAIHALGGVYGNTGYVGIPLVVVTFGAEASVPVIVCLTADLMVMIPLAMFLIEAADGAGENKKPLRIITTTLRSLARNPLIIAIVAGTAVSISGFTHPDMVQSFTELLGAAAAPCALFALGSSVYGLPVRGALGEVGLITCIKLVVHPILVWYVMFELFQVSPHWGFAAVVAATMPVAATVYVLAQQYEIYVIRTSTVILVSTALSLFSITAILAYLASTGFIPAVGSQ